MCESYIFSRFHDFSKKLDFNDFPLGLLRVLVVGGLTSRGASASMVSLTGKAKIPRLRCLITDYDSQTVFSTQQLDVDKTNLCNSQ